MNRRQKEYIDCFKAFRALAPNSPHESQRFHESTIMFRALSYDEQQEVIKFLEDSWRADEQQTKRIH
jgi:hypothetical protein